MGGPTRLPDRLILPVILLRAARHGTRELKRLGERAIRVMLAYEGGEREKLRQLRKAMREADERLSAWV